MQLLPKIVYTMVLAKLRVYALYLFQRLLLTGDDIPKFVLLNICLPYQAQNLLHRGTSYHGLSSPDTSTRLKSLLLECPKLYEYNSTVVQVTTVNQASAARPLLTLAALLTIPRIDSYISLIVLPDAWKFKYYGIGHVLSRISSHYLHFQGSYFSSYVH